MHVVALMVTDGAPIFELAIPAEIFGIDRPDLSDPWYALRVCGPHRGPVRLAGGFSIQADEGYEGAATADTVIVPACTNIHEASPKELVTALQTANSRGVRIAAICSGAFALAEAGLLDGRRATTHWRHAAELSRRYPKVKLDPSVLYCQDGQVFTSAGTAAGIDLCLELVRQDRGSAIANRLARRLVAAPHRAGGQAQYVEAPVSAADDGLAVVMDWALGHLDQSITLREFAAAGTMSARTLARRFKNAAGTTPMKWLASQRVRRAQDLLETTDVSIERVSELVGFPTPSSLRDHFSRTMGVTPRAYRQTFRNAAHRE
jgi:AraC family transcriptional regulator, transcriptional activator FtrA